MIGLYDIHAYVQGPWLVAALVGLGLAVGALSSLFGIGGGILITPLLTAMLGVDPSLAVGSSLSFIIGTSASGVARHARLGNVEFKTTLLLSGGAISGAVIGSQLHVFLQELFAAEGETAGFRMLMNALFIVLLLLTAYLVARKPPRVKSRSLLQRVPIAPRIDLPAAHLAGVSLPGLLAAGLVVGLLPGMLGVGGGIIFMPLLLAVVGLDMRQAIGSSLGIVLFASVAAVIVHGANNNVSLWIAMSLLVGSVLGVQGGACLTQRLRTEQIRRYFALLVLAVAAYVAWDMLRHA